MTERELLYLAMAEPIGLLVTTSDWALARQRLYKARAEAQDPALAILQFRQSSIEGGELVITKGRTIAEARALSAPSTLPEGL